MSNPRSHLYGDGARAGNPAPAHRRFQAQLWAIQMRAGEAGSTRVLLLKQHAHAVDLRIVSVLAWRRVAPCGEIGICVADGGVELGWVDLTTGVESVADPTRLEEFRLAVGLYLRTSAEQSWDQAPVRVPESDDERPGAAGA
jgi:hypothetical protein